MIFAGRNGILNNGGTPRKGASALHAEAVANTATAFRLMGREESDPTNQVYNVAVGDRTTLNQLYEQLHLNLLPSYPHLQGVKPVYRDFRAGDVRHSLADISKAATLLGNRHTLYWRGAENRDGVLWVMTV